MGFSLYVYVWPIPDEHEIYKNSRRSMFNMRITDIRNHISQYSVCEGVGRNILFNTKMHCWMKIMDLKVESITGLMTVSSCQMTQFV